LRPEAPIISQQPNPYSRSVQFAQLQGPSALIVVDGDTVKSPYGVKYRLTGFDAPETWPPECDKELELGQKATAWLQELISGGTKRIIEEGRRTRRGARWRALTVNGRDVGRS
jgi:endonuclease YncB( thermonuclease family)